MARSKALCGLHRSLGAAGDGSAAEIGMAASCRRPRQSGTDWPLDISPGRGHHWRVSESSDPGPDAVSAGFLLAFLTDEWEWETELGPGTLEAAKAAARQALETLVRDENPTLACVTLLQHGRQVGVWDWVQGQPHWTPL